MKQVIPWILVLLILLSASAWVCDFEPFGPSPIQATQTAVASDWDELEIRQTNVAIEVTRKSLEARIATIEAK